MSKLKFNTSSHNLISLSQHQMQHPGKPRLWIGCAGGPSSEFIFLLSQSPMQHSSYIFPPWCINRNWALADIWTERLFGRHSSELANHGIGYSYSKTFITWEAVIGSWQGGWRFACFIEEHWLTLRLLLKHWVEVCKNSTWHVTLTKQLLNSTIFSEKMNIETDSRTYADSSVSSGS